MSAGHVGSTFNKSQSQQEARIATRYPKSGRMRKHIQSTPKSTTGHTQTPTICGGVLFANVTSLGIVANIAKAHHTHGDSCSL